MNTATPTVEPWQLTYDTMPDEEFPDGLRISTDCLARRLIEPLDPDRYHEFPEYLGHRGHGFERILQEWLWKQHGVESLREISVPWAYGETHLDLYLPAPGDLFDTDGRPVQLELKANKEAQVRTENVRQVHRQQWVVEQDHGKARVPERGDDGEWTYVPFRNDLRDAVWILLVIDPVTWRIPDPRGVRVSLTDERRVELAEEWAIMDEFQARSLEARKYAIQFADGMPTCTCGKCFRPEPRQLEDDLVEHAMMYHEIGEDVKEAQAARKFHQQVLKERMLQRFAHLDDGSAQLEHAAGPYVGGGWRVTLAKNGSIRVSKAAPGAEATPIL